MMNQALQMEESDLSQDDVRLTISAIVPDLSFKNMPQAVLS